MHDASLSLRGSRLSCLEHLANGKSSTLRFRDQLHFIYIRRYSRPAAESIWYVGLMFKTLLMRALPDVLDVLNAYF